MFVYLFLFMSIFWPASDIDSLSRQRIEEYKTKSHEDWVFSCESLSPHKRKKLYEQKVYRKKNEWQSLLRWGEKKVKAKEDRKHCLNRLSVSFLFYRASHIIYSLSSDWFLLPSFAFFLLYLRLLRPDIAVQKAINHREKRRCIHENWFLFSLCFFLRHTVYFLSHHHHHP